MRGHLGLTAPVEFAEWSSEFEALHFPEAPKRIMSGHDCVTVEVMFIDTIVSGGWRKPSKLSTEVLFYFLIR